jgi:putative membrane protein
MIADITEKTKQWTAKEYLVLAAKGFVVGAIDVVAGVSGGTIAIIVGVYHDILHALHRFDFIALRLLLSGKWRELLRYIPWKFLSVISLGVFAAVLTMARVLDTAFALFPLYTWSALFGLVGMSAVYVRTNIRRETAMTWICIAAGSVCVCGFDSGADAGDAVVPRLHGCTCGVRRAPPRIVRFVYAHPSRQISVYLERGQSSGYSVACVGGAGRRHRTPLVCPRHHLALGSSQ